MEEQKDSLWLPCPKCRARSKIKIYEDTVLLNGKLNPPAKLGRLEENVLGMRK